VFYITHLSTYLAVELVRFRGVPERRKGRRPHFNFFRATPNRFESSRPTPELNTPPRKLVPTLAAGSESTPRLFDQDQRSLHKGTALLGPFAPVRRGEGQDEGSPTWPWRQTLILSFSPRTGRRDLGAAPLAKQASLWRHAPAARVGTNFRGSVLSSPEEEDVLLALAP
jgi:hypothetical protein